MLPPPDCPEPLQRLRLLLQRWRVEEQVLAVLLAELQVDRDATQREMSWRRLIGVTPEPRLQQRGLQLQEEHDAIAIELAHVRMAIAGAATELARIDPTRLLAS